MAIKNEEVFLESGPHIGDLILNVILAFTVICIPLTIGSIVRTLWVRYRITSRRITVIGGWLGRNRSDVVYSEIAKVITVPRGLGIWGDMVITLKDGSRLELKALPKFREVYAYIEENLSASARQASGSLGKA